VARGSDPTKMSSKRKRRSTRRRRGRTGPSSTTPRRTSAPSRRRFSAGRASNYERAAAEIGPRSDSRRTQGRVAPWRTQKLHKAQTTVQPTRNGKSPRRAVAQALPGQLTAAQLGLSRYPSGGSRDWHPTAQTLQVFRTGALVGKTTKPHDEGDAQLKNRGFGGGECRRDRREPVGQLARRAGESAHVAAFPGQAVRRCGSGAINPTVDTKKSRTGQVCTCANPIRTASCARACRTDVVIQMRRAERTRSSSSRSVASALEKTIRVYRG